MNTHIATAASVVTAGLLMATPAAAGNEMAEKFAADRAAAFYSGNVAALVSQYRPDAIVITPAGVLSEPAQIKALIEGVIGEFAQPGTKFELITQAAIGDVVTFVWKADTAINIYDLGAETYVLKDGLVAYQTIAFKVAAK